MALSNMGTIMRKKVLFSPQSTSSIKSQEMSCPKVYLQEVSQVEYSECPISLSLSLWEPAPAVN